MVDLDAVLSAHDEFVTVGRNARARLLEGIGAALTADRDELVELAHDETGIASQRLSAEFTRTVFQLQELTAAIRSGRPFDEDECDAIAGDPPSGGPAIMRVSMPVGPVVNFEASNFPFAFGTAGCDTAAALAAGSAVVVKIHPAHPKTSRRVLESMQRAIVDYGHRRETVFAVEGLAEGISLVGHPGISAVAFTGSFAFGEELRRLCQLRTPPIPFFGELGSVNPVVVAGDAARSRGAAIADGFVTSLTTNMGQLCTKPGLFFVPKSASAGILTKVTERVAASCATRLISRAIFERAAEHHRELRARGHELLARSATVEPDDLAIPFSVYRTTADAVAVDAELTDEHFGPTGIVVEYVDESDLESALDGVRGSLTVSLHADDLSEPPVPRLVARALRTAGRVVLNGFPTGLPVRDATHHGGPFPAATDARATSVGANSIRRFLRPVSIQGSASDLAALRTIGSPDSIRASLWA